VLGLYGGVTPAVACLMPWPPVPHLSWWLCLPAARPFPSSYLFPALRGSVRLVSGLYACVFRFVCVAEVRRLICAGWRFRVHLRARPWVSRPRAVCESWGCVCEGFDGPRLSPCVVNECVLVLSSADVQVGPLFSLPSAAFRGHRMFNGPQVFFELSFPRGTLFLRSPRCISFSGPAGIPLVRCLSAHFAFTIPLSRAHSGTALSRIRRCTSL